MISKRFLFYSLIGVSGVAVDFLLYYFLYDVLKIDYQTSNFISTSLGITNNFILNSKYNFKVVDNYLKRFIKFYLVGMFGLLLTAAILYISVDVFGGDAIVTKALSIIVVVVVQYTLNKKISFSNNG